MKEQVKVSVFVHENVKGFASYYLKLKRDNREIIIKIGGTNFEKITELLYKEEEEEVVK